MTILSFYCKYTVSKISLSLCTMLRHSDPNTATKYQRLSSRHCNDCCSVPLPDVITVRQKTDPLNCYYLMAWTQFTFEIEHLKLQFQLVTRWSVNLQYFTTSTGLLVLGGALNQMGCINVHLPHLQSFWRTLCVTGFLFFSTKV